MDFKRLLEKLHENGIQISEIKELPGVGKVYTFTAPLPTFPFGGRERRWYSLTLLDGETQIEREEIEALLRHLWHFQIEPLED